MAVFKFKGNTANPLTEGMPVTSIRIRKMNGQTLVFTPPNGHTEWLVDDQLACTDTYCVKQLQHDPRFEQVS